MLTQAELQKEINYNSDTGEFTWKYYKPGRRMNRDIRGLTNGYYHARINGKLYKLHRLAWLYIYGTWPNNEIDHINENKLDNRISNLRDVTRQVNMRNRSKPYKGSAVPHIGVSICKQTGKYKVRRNGVWIGRFTDLDKAVEAYDLSV